MKFLKLFICFICFIFSNLGCLKSFAQTFEVTNFTEFQAALNIAKTLPDEKHTINIASDILFDWGIDIWCTDVHTVTDLDGNPQNFSDKIEIGNHVWIGKDVKINKSIKISDDSIIGWGSIVTKKFNEPNVVLAGNPAKIVKRGINWNFRDLHNYQVYREGLKQN